MPLGSTFLDKYNKANITLLRQLQQINKATAETFFGNQCDGASYVAMSANNAAQRIALNKYAIWDHLLSTRLQGRLYEQLYQYFYFNENADATNLLNPPTTILG